MNKVTQKSETQSTEKTTDSPAEMLLSLDRIRTDGDTQPRQKTDEAVVAEYASRVAEGDRFPPVDVYFDGTDYWLADGFTRVAAFRAAGKKSIRAAVRQGTARDALLHGIEANSRQGQRFSNADKRRAVTLVLADPEWSKWHNREIARRCAVSHEFVNGLRRELATVATSETAEDVLQRYIGREPTAEELALLPTEPPFPSIPQITPEMFVAFLGVAGALREIRDRRLYLTTHPDFYGYCQDRCRQSRDVVDVGFEVLSYVEKKAAA